MDFITRFFNLARDRLKFFGYQTELIRYKKAIKRNPGDHGLKVKIIKLCLYNYLINPGLSGQILPDALRFFWEVTRTDAFDLEIHYLVGKYYQCSDQSKALEIYLDGITRFNRFVERNPGLKPDYADLAYSIALNILSLQPERTDKELDKLFKALRKPRPLNAKSIEREKEMEGRDSAFRTGFKPFGKPADFMRQ
jgi:hypothetical protein